MCGSPPQLPTMCIFRRGCERTPPPLLSPQHGLLPPHATRLGEHLLLAFGLEVVGVEAACLGVRVRVGVGVRVEEG